jgi:hypothetical protein
MVNNGNWEPDVATDYRDRIITDPDNSILASKSNRDRYTNLPNQVKYAGLPYLGSKHSEDALTWNVFRSLQKEGYLRVIAEELGIGKPRGMLLWTLAPELNDANAELQYITGSLIRQFDGRLPGQISEPDVIILGASGLAVVECKLSEPDKPATHLWEGSIGSIQKRRQIYEQGLPGFLKDGISDEAIMPVYQLVRLAFYAMKIAEKFSVQPLLVSLANERNWSIPIRSFQRSPKELWENFCSQILGNSLLECKALSWQSLRVLTNNQPLDKLNAYLSNHPCL